MKYLVLILAFTAKNMCLRPYSAELQPHCGSSWGSWGDPQFCPEGAFATGFKLKVESECGTFCDDTALNGISLICESKSGTDMGTASSKVGLWGTWQNSLLCGYDGQLPRFLRGVQFRSEKETKKEKHVDETAGNNLNGACYNGTVLSGAGTHWGTWSNYELCPSDTAVCGLRTQVEGNQGPSDDTALNQVIFYCCNL